MDARHYPRMRLEGLRKTRKDLSHDSPCSRRDSNRTLLEYRRAIAWAVCSLMLSALLDGGQRFPSAGLSMRGTRRDEQLQFVRHSWISLSGLQHSSGPVICCTASTCTVSSLRVLTLILKRRPDPPSSPLTNILLYRSYLRCSQLTASRLLSCSAARN